MQCGLAVGPARFLKGIRRHDDFVQECRRLDVEVVKRRPAGATSRLRLEAGSSCGSSLGLRMTLVFGYRCGQDLRSGLRGLFWRGLF